MVNTSWQNSRKPSIVAESEMETWPAFCLIQQARRVSQRVRVTPRIEQWRERAYGNRISAELLDGYDATLPGALPHEAETALPEFGGQLYLVGIEQADLGCEIEIWCQVVDTNATRLGHKVTTIHKQLASLHGAVAVNHPRKTNEGANE